MISIIIPIYNQASKIGKCLDSILAQLYNDYEIIIVNDGSTDNFIEVIKEYKIKFINKFNNDNSRFKIINQSNQGSNIARNRGNKEARGEYLLFCDSDLIMQQNMLKLMLNVLNNNPQFSFVYSSFKYGHKLFKLWPYDADRLRRMPYIHTTSLIKAKHFPGFDEKIDRLQDWDLWLTMLEQKHEGIFINQVLFTLQTGGIISRWMPKFIYKMFPLLSQVKEYNTAVKIIQAKHSLN